MNKPYTSFRCAHLLLPAAFLSPFLLASELRVEFEPENHIEVAAGVGLVDGDKASFRAVSGVREDVFGGISSLRYQSEPDDGWVAVFAGRAMIGQDDYAAHLLFQKENFASIRLGFETHRYWSAGYGVAFPNGAFVTPFDPRLGLDRSKFYLEFQLHRPDALVLTLRYTRSMRDGQKVSSVWGDTTRSGPLRSIVPSYHDIDETRDRVELRVDSNPEADVKWSAGAVFDKAEHDNKRIMPRRPGEGPQRFYANREGADNEMFSVHGSVRNQISEQITLMSSANWTNLNGRITGGRLFGATVDPVFDPQFANRQARDYSILDLLGNANLRQFVGTVGALYEPTEHWAIIPSLRFERMYQDVDTEYGNASTGTSATRPTTLGQEAVESNKDFNSIAARLDLRYTGIKRWTFSGQAFYSYGEGSLEEEQFNVAGPTPSLFLERETDYYQERIFFRGGAHWLASQNVRVSFGAYHRFNRSKYEHLRAAGGITGGDRFPAYLRQQDYRVNDIHGRVTWRLASNLTSITRYDYQMAKTFTRAASGLEVRSGRRERQILSQSINWQPLARLSLQTGFNLVNDSLRTPPNLPAGTAAAAIVVPDRMNYYAFNLTGFYALNDTSDLLIVYNGYFHDNRYDNSAVGLPLGGNTEENSLLATYTKRFNENVTWTLQYGLYSLRDGLLGYNADFTAHVVSSRILYRF